MVVDAGINMIIKDIDINEDSLIDIHEVESMIGRENLTETQELKVLSMFFASDMDGDEEVTIPEFQ